jgi:hypothetical protein
MSIENQNLEQESQQQTPSQEGVQESVQEGQQQQQSDVQATQPIWNGKEYALKYRGGEVVPESREKLINWAQLGYSYDQRAASLKAKEQEISQLQQRYAELERLSQNFETNPQFKQSVLDLYYKSMGNQVQGQVVQQGQGQAGDNLSAFQPYLKKIDDLQSRFESYENHQADVRLNEEIESLKSKYKDIDWNTPDVNGRTLLDDVKKESHRMDGIPLEAAFRNLYWDQMQAKIKADTLKAQADEAIAKKKKGVVASAEGSTGGQVPVQNNNSRGRNPYDNIARQTIAELQR